MSDQRFFWLKLKKDFFKRHDIRIVEEMTNGKDYVLFYLKLLLESIDHNGELRFSDSIPYSEEMLSVITNTHIDIVGAAMHAFIQLGMVEVDADGTIYMTEMEKLIGSEGAGAKRVRKHREKKETPLKPDTPSSNGNNERQRRFRAKKDCEEKQHVPPIDDNTNSKRYGGNYYLVMKRDECRCARCGSIDSLCVHHIDGYKENQPENNTENRLVVLCRACHAQVQAGTTLPDELLDRIHYQSVTPAVTHVTHVTHVTRDVTLRNAVTENVTPLHNADVTLRNADVTPLHAVTSEKVKAHKTQSVQRFAGVTQSDVTCNADVTQSDVTCNVEKEIEIDKELELEIDERESTGAAAPTPSSSGGFPSTVKPKLHKYGQFGWVRLTDKQHACLLADLGAEELSRCIAYIDESAQLNGNKNKWRDWNLVIRRCHREGWGRGFRQGSTSKVDVLGTLSQMLEAPP